MKQKFLSALCLVTLCAPAAGPLFAQGAAKQRPASAPLSIVKADAKPEPAGLATGLSEARVYADGRGGAVIDWTTGFEIENLGFNIYRVDAAGEKQQVNADLIGGSWMTQASDRFPQQSGKSYLFYDENGSATAGYYIETVSKTNARQSYGPFAPSYISDISRILGYDRAAHRAFTAQNTGSIITDTPQSAAAKSASAKSVETTAAALETQQWVAAQPGVKLAVDKTGMHRVTRAQLQAAGFDVSGNLNNWQLYVGGVQQAMTVEPAGDYIEFYGRAGNHPSSGAQVYYLITGPQAGIRIPSIVRRPFSGEVMASTFRTTLHQERQAAYLNEIVNGEADNWFDVVVTNVAAVNRTVVVKDPGSDPYGVTINLAFQGLTYSDHNVRVRVNGVLLTNLVFNGRTHYRRSINVKSSFLQPGENTFEFLGTGPGSDHTMFDYVEVEYPRQYVADQNELYFDVINLRATKVSGFTTPDVRVYDLASPAEPALISNATVTPGPLGTFDVNIPSGRGRAMLATPGITMKSPASITANVPSTLSASTSAADMLIVSHRNFMTEANTWANYRRAQGLVVDVINADDVYDEFDFGIPSPEAVKGYLRYAVTNFANLKYALLVGDASYDPRGFENHGMNDFIPTKFINTNFGEAPSDETLGDLDNDGVSEVAIGRLPVRSASEIPFLLDKVADFESVVATSMATRGVLFVADDNDGYDFAQVNQLLSEELPPGTPVNFIRRPDDPDINVIRQRIVNDINAGNSRFIVNYTGHGSTRGWSTSQMFRQLVAQPPPPAPPVLSELQQLTNSGQKLSLFLMLTCLNGFFVDPVQDNLAEALIKAPNGGSATTWASTGSTTPDIQQIMATRFFHILGQGTYSRLGDAIKASKLDAPFPDVPLTWALMGDPALKIK